MSLDRRPALPSPLTILVVDDHPLIRQGIHGLVSTAVAELDVVEAASAEGALERLLQASPDLIIVDVALPDGNGLDLIREIRDAGVGVPIIALSIYSEEGYAERALRAGASGYVMKEEAGGVLLEAIERVLSGEVHLSPRVARSIAGKLNTRTTAAGGAIEDILTERELEVWHHLGSGLSTRRIAARLEISPKTVETHCYNIRRKTDIANMTELVHSATRWVHGDPGRA